MARTPMAAAQLSSSLAASAGLFFLSALAIALLAVTIYILGIVGSFAVFCIKEFARRADDRPPLIGTMFRMLKNIDRLFDDHAGYKTEVMKDLFGDGIFATDGDKWQHQRKLASHEFSTRVLRDYSSGVFRVNAAKLARKISLAAANRIAIDMQDGKIANEDDTLPNGYRVLEDDTLPNGYRVLKGDGMNYMIYAMGRMTYLWGEDAEEFRPERWLINGVFQHESLYKFVSFNAGPRLCLGKDFAYRQMKIVAATLVNFFRFKLEDEFKEPTYKTMFTLHIDKGLRLYAYPCSSA